MPISVYRLFGVLEVATLLIFVGCSRSDDASDARPALTMDTLGQKGTEGWLASRLNASKPVHFFSTMARGSAANTQISRSSFVLTMPSKSQVMGGSLTAM